MKYMYIKTKMEQQKLDMIYKYNIHHEFLVFLCPVYDYVPQLDNSCVLINGELCCFFIITEDRVLDGGSRGTRYSKGSNHHCPKVSVL